MTFSLVRNNKIVDNPKEQYPLLNIYVIIIAFLPFWWRFLQCLNKWYNGNKLQLINAAKYFSKFLAPITILCGSSNTLDNQNSSINSYIIA